MNPHLDERVLMTETRTPGGPKTLKDGLELQGRNRETSTGRFNNDTTSNSSPGG